MTMENLYPIYLQHPSVQTDTRKLQKGDLYFALKGPNFNGNSFAQKALEQGAAFAIIDEAEYAIEGKTILVEDVLTTLQQLALHHRRQFNIPFLAITGSNGKTTTKELIHAVLSTTFQTYTTEGNLNNHIGVPLTILKIKKDAEMAVIEMGANHRKEIASYCVIEGDVIGTVVQSDPFLNVDFTKGISGEVNTSLVGAYNLPNMLAAVAVGKVFGVEEEKIKAAIANYTPSNSRSQLVQKGSNKIILDAYNANPSSMKAAIDNFSKAEGQNKILVLGAMAELGPESLAEHQSIINEIGQHKWKAVLLVGGDFVRSNHSFLSFTKPEEAGEWLRQQNMQDAFLLVKGSRSMQMEKVLNYL
ncbi:MAG: UDP-N-acetylmuramoyl-tripeptide--D-alanyl-D-alanine ligase [Chitinophagaceae bacterium]|nr:MAG: UDP-N-acetylmuramoyl-tripeptide--D-alanyl-D-alanine ligase [Chitinophagaceae bacterium]